jgi:DNA-binding CsgD family transcriptional regulator
MSALGLEPLTSAERRVLALLAHGCTNAEIADSLVVSPNTVKTHVVHILAKIGLPNRHEAGRWYWEQWEQKRRKRPTGGRERRLGPNQPRKSPETGDATPKRRRKFTRNG